MGENCNLAVEQSEQASEPALRELHRGEVRTNPMIAKAELMPALLAACPSFLPEWQAFLEEWKDEADDLPLYIAIGQFARHLIGMLERNELAAMPLIFEAIERLHVEGDQYVKEAATVGHLEDRQNLNLHRTTKPAQFRPYLGPQSAAGWDELYRF
jgi:hypothetical protein